MVQETEQCITILVSITQKTEQRTQKTVSITQNTDAHHKARPGSPHDPVAKLWIKVHKQLSAGWLQNHPRSNLFHH